MNTYPFFRKWLREVAVDQRPDGSIPHVVPDLLRVHNEDDAIINGDASGATGWGDAAVICPWVLYLTFGDTQILSAQYDSMVKWVDFMYNNARRRALEYRLPLWRLGQRLDRPKRAANFRQLPPTT